MLPEAKRMILNMEHVGPTTNISPLSLQTLSGFVDYTAVVASERTAGRSAPILTSTARLIVFSRYLSDDPEPSHPQDAYAA